MTYRLEPQRSLTQTVRQIAAAQIGEVLTEFGKAAPSATAVHETRKAIKRLRALLQLIRHGVNPDDLRREKQRLRHVAHSLAGARDAQVMLETACKLKDGPLSETAQGASQLLIGLLEKQRVSAEAKLSTKAGTLPLAELEQARAAMRTLPLDSLTLDKVFDAFTEAYRRGRKRHAALRADSHDEGFHDLRKDVQKHWRHLQLFSEAWPKTMRPYVSLARSLSETLGEDHDLAVLAVYVRENSGKLGPMRGVEAYLRACASRQTKLRQHADLLARRLYAEKPGALCRRIAAYWSTAESLRRTRGALASGNVVALPQKTNGQSARSQP